MIRLNTIRFKISILYVAILGVILVAYSAILYFSLRYVLYHDLDAELRAKAGEVAIVMTFYAEMLGTDESDFITAAKKTIQLQKEGPLEGTFNAAEVRWYHNIDRYDLRRDYLNILDAFGEPLFMPLDFNPKLLSLFSKIYKSEAGKGTFFTDVNVNKRALHVIHTPYKFGEKKYIIQIGTSLKPTIQILKARLRAVVVSIPIILLLASFIGRLFALRILKPVMEIAKTAEKITHEDLSARVSAAQADEEIKSLAGAFNDMIARLEKSFRYIAEFSSHVAHELKTPLTIIRGESQVALRNERSSEEYQRVLKVNLEEAQRMIRVVEDMLLLTKLEYESEVFRFERLDLKDFMTDILEQSKVLAEPKKIKVRMALSDEGLTLLGDSLHLRRLVFNLIDNAIKFSPENSTIDLSVRNESGTVKILISDQGIGILETDLPKVFEKFFHRDRRNNTDTTSTGLGLSLALSIAKAHRGNIEVKSRPGKGSAFTVNLPFSR